MAVRTDEDIAADAEELQLSGVRRAGRSGTWLALQIVRNQKPFVSLIFFRAVDGGHTFLAINVLTLNTAMCSRFVTP